MQSGEDLKEPKAFEEPGKRKVPDLGLLKTPKLTPQEKERLITEIQDRIKEREAQLPSLKTEATEIETLLNSKEPGTKDYQETFRRYQAVQDQIQNLNNQIQILRSYLSRPEEYKAIMAKDKPSKPQ